MRTVIRGMGKYLPEKEYTSEEIEERAGFKRLGIKQGLVRMLTGCETRHYADDNEWCSDIAAKAGAEAIKDAGLVPSDIDAVIFGAITRDFAEPATVNRVVQLLANIRSGYHNTLRCCFEKFHIGIHITIFFQGRLDSTTWFMGYDSHTMRVEN